MEVTWRLRMAAAQREIWTGAALRRLLAERAGLELSPASVSALMSGQPRQVKLSTLAALCTALDCGPGDLIEVDTTPVPVAPRPKHREAARALSRSGTVDAATVRAVAVRGCSECGLPTMAGGIRCSRCYSRRQRAGTIGTCGRCGKRRPLIDPSGRCDFCVYVARARPARVVPPCTACGEHRALIAHGRCNRCLLKMPERTWTYAAGLVRRLGEGTPEWFDAFVAHVAARYSPSEACLRLGELGRLLVATNDPAGLVASATHDNGKLTPLGWALEEFLSARGLVAAGGDVEARSRQRRERIIARAPESLRDAVERFAAVELANQRRAKRVGARPRADQTLHIHLGVIVDFACANPEISDWASVGAHDIEAFLARHSPVGSHLLPSLRIFFVWARSARLVLVDPTQDLHSSTRRHFAGSVIDLPAQRQLFRRWTTDESVRPNEALIGLLALVHGVSVDELRQLMLDDIDQLRHAVAFRDRAHLVPLDPSTWSALERVLRHREALGTCNSHVLVNRRTKVTSQPVARCYAGDLLRPLGVSPKQLRCCRLAQLATTTDPMLVSELFGLSYDGVEYYLGDQVDEARLTNL